MHGRVLFSTRSYAVYGFWRKPTMYARVLDFWTYCTRYTRLKMALRARDLVHFCYTPDTPRTGTFVWLGLIQWKLNACLSFKYGLLLDHQWNNKNVNFKTRIVFSSWPQNNISDTHQGHFFPRLRDRMVISENPNTTSDATSDTALQTNNPLSTKPWHSNS